MTHLCYDPGEAKGSRIHHPHEQSFLQTNSINMFKYKGYVGSFTYDEKLYLFLGKVPNIRDIITFQGKSVESTRLAFKDAVNEYLDWCKKYGKTPEKPLPVEYKSY